MRKKWVKEKYEDVASKFNMNYRAYYMRVYRFMLKGYSEEAANRLVKEKLIRKVHGITPVEIVHSTKVTPVEPKITNIEIQANKEGTTLTTFGVLATYKFTVTKNLSPEIYDLIVPLLLGEFNKCS